MAEEKFITGKHDSSRHHGRRSYIRRFQESVNQLKEYMTETPTFEVAQRANLDKLYHRTPELVGGDPEAGMKPIEVVVFTDTRGEGVLIPGVNIMMEEANDLIARGAIFPLETAQPERRAFFKEPHI